MRIAYVNPQAVPDTTPSTIQILQFANALATVGAEVFLVTPEAKQPCATRAVLGREGAEKLHFVHFPEYRKRWFFPFSSGRIFLFQALRWLKGHPVDVVYVRNLKLAEFLLKRLPQLKICFETHELFAQSFAEDRAPLGYWDQRKLRTLKSREAFVYHHVAGIVGITRALLEDIGREYGVATPCLLAPDGVDMTLAAAARPAPEIPHPRPVILYLGSLHRWKGVETALAAMEHVPGCDFWVAGGNDERIRELQQWVGRQGLAEQVRFLGRIAPAQRFDLIAVADICLLPLLKTSIGARYTSPLKLFEYMSMGKAIVASDHPSLREVLVSGRNALLVEAENPLALAEAINTLQAHPELGQALGAQAKQDALQYAWENRSRAVLAWLEKLAPRWGNRARMTGNTDK